MLDHVIAGEPILISRRGPPVVRLVLEEQPKKPFDVETMQAIRVMSKPYVDPDGLSFVERLKLNGEF